MTSYGLDSSWISGEQVSRTRQPWGFPHSFLWLSAEASDVCPGPHGPSASPSFVCLVHLDIDWFMVVLKLRLDRLGSGSDQFSKGLADSWSSGVWL